MGHLLSDSLLCMAGKVHPGNGNSIVAYTRPKADSTDWHDNVDRWCSQDSTPWGKIGGN